jgi:hypothetical protein
MAAKPSEPAGAGASGEAADAMQTEVNALRRDVEILQAAMGTVLGYEGISKALSEIAEHLDARLQPLRFLTPPTISEGLPANIGCASAALELSLKRPDWKNVEQLSIETKNVLGIGDPARPLPPDVCEDDDYAIEGAGPWPDQPTQR